MVPRREIPGEWVNGTKISSLDEGEIPISKYDQLCLLSCYLGSMRVDVVPRREESGERRQRQHGAAVGRSRLLPSPPHHHRAPVSSQGGLPTTYLCRLQPVLSHTYVLCIFIFNEYR